MTPFKVVCIRDRSSYEKGVPEIHKGTTYTVIDLDKCEWLDGRDRYVFAEMGNTFLYAAEDFAPIVTNYSDATAEILEKYPVEVGGVPDRIIVPQKETV